MEEEEPTGSDEDKGRGHRYWRKGRKWWSKREESENLDGLEVCFTYDSKYNFDYYVGRRKGGGGGRAK